MRGPEKSVLSWTISWTIAALTIALSSSVFSLSSGSPARAAGTCLDAPKPAPPAGQHWRYRTDRELKRKCWYLASKDGARPSAAAPAETETPPADEPVEPPTTTGSVAEKPSKPEPQQQQPAWITRNVSETGSNAGWLTREPDRPADTIANADVLLRTPDQQAQAPSAVAEAQTPEPQPVQQPLMLADVAAASPAPARGAAAGRALVFTLLAFSLIGILAGAVFGFIELRRRRSDVLNRTFQPDAGLVPTSVTVDRPTFAPLPPIRQLERRDDVDEALERFQGRRRRAAYAA
jgi:hypothetical protein